MKLQWMFSIDRSLNYGRHHIRKWYKMIQKAKMDDVLDIGAGYGSDLLLAREVKPDVRLHAIEISPEYQNVLKQQDITVYPIDIEHQSIPLPNESMDVIVANMILEHIKEVFWVFHEISRVLRMGGHLIIGVPNLASLHNRLLLLFGKQPSCIQNYTAHVRGYTKGDLLKLLSLCYPDGYALTRSGGGNFYPFPPGLAKPLATVFPNHAWGITLLMRKQKNYTGDFLRYPREKHLDSVFYSAGQ